MWLDLPIQIRILKECLNKFKKGLQLTGASTVPLLLVCYAQQCEQTVVGGYTGHATGRCKSLSRLFPTEQLPQLGLDWGQIMTANGRIMEVTNKTETVWRRLFKYRIVDQFVTINQLKLFYIFCGSMNKWISSCWASPWGIVYRHDFRYQGFLG